MMTRHQYAVQADQLLTEIQYMFNMLQHANVQQEAPITGADTRPAQSGKMTLSFSPIYPATLLLYPPGMPDLAHPGRSCPIQCL